MSRGLQAAGDSGTIIISHVRATRSTDTAFLRCRSHRVRRRIGVALTLLGCFLCPGPLRADWGEVCILWEISATAGILGFNILRRERGGDRVAPVNDKPIRVGSTAVGRYEVVDRPPAPGKTYLYELESLEADGSRVILARKEATVGRVPSGLVLHPNHPNPFTSSAWIRSWFPSRSRVPIDGSRQVGNLGNHLTAADCAGVRCGSRTRVLTFRSDCNE